MGIFLFSLLSIACYINNINGQSDIFEFSCPTSDCDSDPCGPDDNEYCEEWDTQNSDECIQCEDGYWAISVSYKCKECLSSIGCSNCRFEAGCTECTHGGVWTWTDECGPIAGVNYCEGADMSQEIIDDTTTSSPDNTSPTEEDDDDTTDTDTDTDTSDDIETEGAIALFGSDGIDGSVKVINGHVSVSLDLHNFNFDLISDVDGEDCFRDGLYYGIYDEWNHDSTNNMYGTSDCSYINTGERFDPWLACSDKSSNEYCTHHGGSSSCVPPSSWQWNPDDNGYVCSEVLYESNPFACEVGDLSGKYGRLEYDSLNKSISGGGTSPYEVDSYDLSGKSIVFRCYDYSRVFCAPFQEYIPSSTNEESELTRPFQNLTYSQIAYFSDNSYIKLTYFHMFYVRIDVKELIIPGSCGDEIYYRIFTDSESTLSSGTLTSTCDSGDVGYFYDPTLTCNENSENVEKGYCDDTQLCWDPHYVYSCESNDYYFNRFYCGPGDLSNKYGSISIEDGTSFWFNQTGYDPLMVPLSLLEGRSIVLQCSNDYEIIGCATFEDYKLDIGYGNTINPDYWENLIKESENEDSDEKESDKKSDAANKSNILGVSNEVAIIMAVLVVLSIFPCVRGCRNRSNKDKMPKHEKNKGSHAEDIMTTIHTNRSKSHNRDNNSRSQSHSSHNHGKQATIPAMQGDIAWMNN